MISFLGALALNAAFTVLGRLLSPRIKRPERPELEVPFGEEGTAIQLVFGTQLVNPTLMAFGDRQRDTTSATEQTLYRGKFQYSVCQGPIHQLLDVQFDGKSLALWPSTKASSNLFGTWIGEQPVSSIPFPIDNPNNGLGVTTSVRAFDMFGGYKESGGLSGPMTFMFGEDAQDISPLTAHFHDAPYQPGWPNVAILELGDGDDGFYLNANTGQMPDVKCIVSCFPHALLGSVEEARIGNDANPAEVLYALWVHRLRGAGLSEALIDIASFTAKAVQWKNEGLGVSLTVGSGKSLEEIKAVGDDVCKATDSNVFQDIESGLFVLRDARATEDIATIEEITEDNSWDFRLIPGSWSNTYNEIKLAFNEFFPGTNGHIPSELVTSDFHGGWDGAQSYQLQGRNISTLALYKDAVGGTLLIPDVDYRIEDAALGWIQINDEGGVVSDGDVIYAEYDAAPTFMGFKDGVVQMKNMANLQMTREPRTLEVDYPMFTSRPVAQRWINRLGRQYSRPIKRATWKMNTHGHAVGPASAVKITRAIDRLTEFRMRVIHVDYGHLEEGYLQIEAAEDVFADDISYGSDAVDPPAPPHGLPIAPAMAITCMTPGQIRIGLFASDPTFNIVVWRADDAIGTGATMITVATGIAGTTAYLDDPQADGVTKYYMAYLVRPGFQDGSPTAWIGCTSTVGTPPEEPECVEPTYTVTADDDLGTVTLTITDPQSRVTEVRFRTKSGNGVWSAWVVTAFPYEAEVALSVLADSRIEWEIDYLACDGTEGTLSGGYDFLLNPPIDPGNVDEFALTQIAVQDDIWQGTIGEDIELVGIGQGKLAARVSLDNGATWAFFDASGADEGPFVGLENFGPVKGAYAIIDEAFRTEVLYEIGTIDQDGVFAPLYDLDDEPMRVYRYIGGFKRVRIKAGVRTPGSFSNDPAITYVRLEWVNFTDAEEPPPDPEAPPGIEGCVITDTYPVTRKLIFWGLSNCGLFTSDGTGLKIVDTIYDLSPIGTNDLGGGAVSGANVKRLTKATGGAIPQQNGRDPISFRDAWLQFPTGLFTGVTEAEWFIVMKADNGDPAALADRDYFHQMGPSDDSRLAESTGGGAGTGRIREDFGSSVMRDTGNFPGSLSSFFIYNVRAAPGYYRIYKYTTADGEQLAFTSDTNTVAFSAAPRMGNRGQNSDFLWLEQSIHSGIMTNAERASIVATMLARHAI